jgi:O-antigen biosynthesis protein
LRRSLKLLARGDRARARRLLIDGMVALRVAPAPLPRLGAALDLLQPHPAVVAPLADRADVIVPVHNGVNHLRRLLASLFDHTDPRHRILLADDGSSDPEVTQILAWASRRPNVRVLHSETNRGFIATVNAAMDATLGHAAILNTDTEVPAGWLERLLQPIATGARIASTTPFSNAAAIYSFPTPDLDHELPDALHVAEIDAAFARLRADDGPLLTAPTAIGFCMGINRAAWRDCGTLDEATFGRGYCEETDWCLRAVAAGWRSVLVPNLFVYHAHGGTFDGGERKALLEANIAALHRRWPAYYRKLATFRRGDPWADLRAAALLALAHGRGVVGFGRAREHGASRLSIERGPWRMELSGVSPRELGRLSALAGGADGALR